MTTLEDVAPRLTERLAERFEEPDDEHREAYRLKDDRHAAWALDKLGTFLDEIDRVRAAAVDRRRQVEDDELYQELRAELDQVDTWEKDRTAGPERSADYFRHLLTEYMADVLDANPAVPKTYTFPNGEISRRKQPDRVEVLPQRDLEPPYVDTPAGRQFFGEFVCWAILSGRFDLLKIEPKTDALKRAIQIIPLGHKPDDDAAPGALFVRLVVDGKNKPKMPGERSNLLTADGQVIPGLEYVVGVEKIGDPVVVR